MPRYFFNLHDGCDMPDPLGTVLPDISHARMEAIRFAGEMLRDGGAAFWQGEKWTMEVHNESGELLITLQFAAILSAGALARADDEQLH